ncbi:MAG: hypothetical protein KDA27_08690 [Candidatus Eisenbacteria bacterium]|uniref:Uncharacterized protein n=1 Tax=Eiseniibacteriota bacterium TaxID=2212470 RepID=A0A956NBG0_UNCEI|nr:hypothetical protein [Candidatus Eisenbacteria bacterium]MCB9463138.1 hypothetical protein [Candidatus Eisenbacteria bacterium]
MRRSYRNSIVAAVAAASLVAWIATPILAALPEFEQAPRGWQGDGPPPPPNGGEGEDEEEVLIRARPGVGDQDSVLENDLLSEDSGSIDVSDWLTHLLERLGLRF